jgi:hypothetical protein
MIVDHCSPDIFIRFDDGIWLTLALQMFYQSDDKEMDLSGKVGRRTLSTSVMQQFSIWC